MRYLSVCSGIEAATVAWHQLGWEPAGFSEIEPFSSAVLAHHYPKVPNLGDMTKFKEWDIGTIDLLVGGTPCQSFSVAGLRKGLKDPRGNLMLTFLASAQHHRPRWVVWENVPGVLSSNGGRDFGTFLGALGELGYGWAYRVLDAQWFGVAQRRRRVFVVGYFGDQRRAAAVLFERESVCRDSPPSREKGQAVAGIASAGVAIGCEQIVDAPLMFKVRGGSEVDTGTRGSTTPGAGAGKGYLGSTDHAFTLAASPDQWVAQPIAFHHNAQASQLPTDARDTSISDSLTVSQQAAVAQPIAIQGTLIGRNENAGPQGSGVDERGSMFTLTKTDVHAVAFAQNQLGEVRVGSVTNTLNTNSNASGRNTPMVMQPVGTDCYNGAITGDVAATLGTPGSSVNASGPTVMQPIGLDEEQNAMVDAFGTLKARTEGGGFEGSVMTPTMQVRRLTPVECERLQGFPDGYTNIPWRKQPESPDGPRYKSLGNSMAVPVMRWIGERIKKVES